MLTAADVFIEFAPESVEQSAEKRFSLYLLNRKNTTYRAFPLPNWKKFQRRLVRLWSCKLSFSVRMSKFGSEKPAPISSAYMDEIWLNLHSLGTYDCQCNIGDFELTKHELTMGDLSSQNLLEST